MRISCLAASRLPCTRDTAVQAQRVAHHVDLVVEQHLVDRARIAQVACLELLRIVVERPVAAHGVRLRILALQNRPELSLCQQIARLVLQRSGVRTQIRKISAHGQQGSDAQGMEWRNHTEASKRLEN